MDGVLLQTFKAILERLHARVGEAVYGRWFRDTTLLGFARGVMTVGVPNVFFREWIAENYVDTIAQAARDILGVPIQVDVKVDPVLFREHRARLETAVAEAPVRPQSFEAVEPLLVAENEFGLGAVNHMVSGKEPLIGRLFLHGAPGTGKSLLLNHASREFRKLRPEWSIAETTGPRFAAQFTLSLKSKKIAAFREPFDTCDVLLFDEVHRLRGKRATQVELLNLLQRLLMRGAKVMMASRHHPKEISDILPSLQSLFLHGMTIALKPYSTASLLSIYDAGSMGAKKAPREVVERLAAGAGGDARVLQERVRKTSVYAEFLGEKASCSFVEEHMPEILASGSSNRDVVDWVLAKAAAHYGVKRDDVHSKRKVRTLMAPRGLAVCLMRDALGFTFARIGQVLGGRSHTSAFLIYKAYSPHFGPGGKDNDTYARLARSIGWGRES